MVGSPLLSYLDVQLPEFLSNKLTIGEARHLGPKLVKQDSLEPVCDLLGDNVFQGRAVHIPIEASVLEDPIAEDPIIEDPVVEDPIIKEPITKELVPINLTVGIVHKSSMALDRWYPAVLPIRSQATPHSISQQTIPPTSQQRRKQQKGANSATTRTSTPSAV